MDGARGSEGRDAAEAETAEDLLARIYELNPWAKGLDIKSDAFAVARQNACVNRWIDGVEAWNAWAAGMLEIRPQDREGVAEETFQEVVTADFSHLCFVGDVDFIRFEFPGHTEFRNSVFGGSGRFAGDAYFNSASFGSSAWFENAIFSGDAFFYATLFSGGFAFFAGATFRGRALFGAATFSGDSAVFRGATFGKMTDFSVVEFTSHSRTIVADFSRADFNGEVYFGASVFDAAIFCSIKSERSFSIGSTFKATPDFREASFHEPPQLDEAEIKPCLSRRHVMGDCRRPPLDWAKHAPNKDEHAKFRALRGMADQGNDHTSALRFNANEIAARRFWVDEPFGLNASRFWLGWLYQLVSDYGRSILRPLIGLFAVVATFAALFYAGAQSDDPKTSWTRECHQSVNREELKLQPTDKVTEAISLSIRNALIFDRSDTSRRTYGCLYGLVDNGRSGAIPTWVGKLSLLESLLSAIFLFLIGLALRNMFRLG